MMAGVAGDMSLYGELGLYDSVTGVIGKIENAFAAFRSGADKTNASVTKLQTAFDQMKVGLGLTAIGATAGMIAKGMIEASLETDKLKSNLASLGLAAKDIDAIAISGNTVTSELGIAKSAYLTAAYDIESAISSMNATDLSAYARTVGETAIEDWSIGFAKDFDFTDFAQLVRMRASQVEAMKIVSETCDVLGITTVALIDFNVNEQRGEETAIPFSLSLQEYVPIKLEDYLLSNWSKVKGLLEDYATVYF